MTNLVVAQRDRIRYAFLGVLACLATLHSPAQLSPHLYIDAGGAQIPDEPKVPVRLRIVAGDTLHYDGFAGAEVRGRSSQSFPKQGYALETRHPDGTNRDVSLLGMPSENDWVLHGPYADKSLVRNALAYAIHRSLGHYAPRTRFCELTVDGDYRGVYLLTEEVKRDPARVAIDRPKPGAPPEQRDYLLAINASRDAPGDGWTNRPARQGGFDLQHEYQYEDPKPEELSAPEKAYLRSWFDALEDVMLESDFDDTATGYAQYIELDGWIDYILVNEVSADVDAFFGSTYFVKRSATAGGKLAAGPTWDHNFAFGNADYCAGTAVTGFAIDHESTCQYRRVPLIFARLWDDPTFRTRLAARYFEHRAGPLGPGVSALLDSLKAEIAPLQEANFERWPVLGTYLWPNPQVSDTWEGEFAYLSDWVNRRLVWLDGELAKFLPAGGTRPINSVSWVINPNPARRGGTLVLTPSAPVAEGETIMFELHQAGSGALALSLPAEASFAWLDLPNTVAPGVYVATLLTRDGEPLRTQRVVIVP